MNYVNIGRGMPYKAIGEPKSWFSLVSWFSLHAGMLMEMES